jgi:Short C-terminal domain
MTRSRTTRSDGRDLLARPPCGVGMYEDGWMDLVVDSVGQLTALADLHARGLLSPEEFERQKAKVIER